jgi:hypothetical protein
VAYPPLTHDSDLAGYPGAPFADGIIRAAEASIRKDCNWHIAPQVTEALTVECCDSRRLVLKTLRLVSVASVVGDDAVAVTGFKFRSYGVLFPPDGKWWTVGRVYTVTATHGYDSADDLLPVVASRCLRQAADPGWRSGRRRWGSARQSESYNVGRFDESLGGDYGSPLDRYRIAPIG